MTRVCAWLLGLCGVSALAACQLEAGSWVLCTRVGSAIRVISAMAVPGLLGPPYLRQIIGTGALWHRLQKHENGIDLTS